MKLAYTKRAKICEEKNSLIGMIFFVEEKFIIFEKFFSIRRKMKTNESIILFEEKIN